MDHSHQDGIAEAAGFWDARLCAADCSEEDRRNFRAWRDADIAHHAAFERLQLIVASLRSAGSRAELRALRDSALALSQRRGRRLRRALAAGLACLGVTTALWVAKPNGWNLGDGKIHSTGLGQRDRVTLQDGSAIELNSNTKVAIKFTEARRAITLLDGQAVFHVAQDSRRPFSVNAGDRQVLALGTVFDVKLDRSAVRITLLDGKVSITQAEKSKHAVRSYILPPAEPVVLAPGQQLVVTARDGTPTQTVRSIDAEKVTGWRQGRVFMQDLSLAEAVAEMNRYSTTTITVADSALEALRVNGMFRAGEQQAFATALESYFSIRAQPRGDTEIVLTSRP